MKTGQNHEATIIGDQMGVLVPGRCIPPNRSIPNSDLNRANFEFELIQKPLMLIAEYTNG